MTFTKGHPYGKRFVMGKTPPPHREGCGCFRCTGKVWNEGISTKHIVGAKISESLRGKFGEESRRWLGDKAKIKAIHMWIYKHYGLATRCDKCGNNNASKYEWSNISRTYKREMEDWWQLCISCHRKYDHPKNRR